ncbi:MAG: lactate utilization protein C, partial [Hyphomicrobiaceae bacterium]
MSSRLKILGKVHAAMGPSRRRGSRAAAVDARLAAHRRHVVLSRVAGKPTDQLLATMRRWLEAASADLIEIADDKTVPATVAGYLGAHGLPLEVRIGDDGLLAGLPWESIPSLVVDHGRADPADKASVTRALAAVAETGTLVVASGPQNPVTLSFLPDVNIVVVRRADVVRQFEDAWERVRAGASAGGLPRTLNLISGPSRAADIGGIPV